MAFRCPQCEKPCDPSARTCGHCGASLTASAVVVSNPDDVSHLLAEGQGSAPQPPPQPSPPPQAPMSPDPTPSAFNKGALLLAALIFLLFMHRTSGCNDFSLRSGAKKTTAQKKAKKTQKKAKKAMKKLKKAVKRGKK